MVAQPNAESRLLPVIFLGLSLKGGFGKGEGHFWARLEVSKMAKLAPDRACLDNLVFVEFALLPSY